MVRLPLVLFAMTAISTTSPQNIVPLWNGPAPFSHGTTPNDIPTLTVFLPEKASQATSAVVICPGGGYGFLAFDYEGINEAEWFQQRGVAAFVLKYRLPAKGYRHPVPLLDVQRAIRLVRSHAADWKINPAKVGIMGFSAGGHLASTLETHFDAGNPLAVDPVDQPSCRPDFAVLVYAVISMKDGVTDPGSKNNLLGPHADPQLAESLSNETQVTPQTPPTLMVHAVDDEVVPIEKSSRLMYAALQKAGVPSALQEYSHGSHGFGFGPNQKNAPPGWLDKAYDWLKAQGFMP